MKALQLLYNQQPVYVDLGFLGHDTTVLCYCFPALQRNIKMSGDTTPEAQHHIPADLTPQEHCCENLIPCTGRPCMFNFSFQDSATKPKLSYQAIFIVLLPHSITPNVMFGGTFEQPQMHYN
jgi:hypothetical protein